MNKRDFGRIIFMTLVLSSFVIYLFVSVSKLLPFFFVAVLAVVLMVRAIPAFQTFSGIKMLTQKIE